jgi:hypothetical protein
MATDMEKASQQFVMGQQALNTALTKTNDEAIRGLIRGMYYLSFALSLAVFQVHEQVEEMQAAAKKK